MSTDFKPTARSRAKRLHKRAHYDRATIYSIIDAAVLAHVGYVIDGQPFVTPTNCWRDGDRVLWHGSMASRMLKTVRERVPVCVTITHLDGLVMARSAFHHSVNYRSVMLFGRAEMVSDKEEKERALEAFVERIAPGRWATLRPMTAKELKATMVVSMQIEEASAKVRTGPLRWTTRKTTRCRSGRVSCRSSSPQAGRSMTRGLPPARRCRRTCYTTTSRVTPIARSARPPRIDRPFG